jgi:hypothetical protein
MFDLSHGRSHSNLAARGASHLPARLSTPTEADLLEGTMRKLGGLIR